MAADAFDHIQPKILGGGDTMDNLVPACAACNYRRGAQVGNQLRGVRRHPERWAPRRWASSRDW